MKRKLIIILLLTFTTYVHLISVDHYFKNGINDVDYSTDYMNSHGNISQWDGSSFFLNRIGMYESVDYACDDEVLPICITDVELEDAIINAVDKFNNLTDNSSEYSIELDTDFDFWHNPTVIKFSDEIDDFDYLSQIGKAHCQIDANTHEIIFSEIILNESNEIHSWFFDQYNDGDFEWTFDGETALAEHFLDLNRNIMHEMGHTIGIDHITGYGVENENEVMAEHSPVDCIVDDLGIGDEISVKGLYDDETTYTETYLTNMNQNFIFDNSPNPFNPATTISYSLAKNPVNPTIEIYNIKGQKVKTFELESEKGENSIMWKGKDYTNKRVSSGVYMYRLINNGKSIETKKMMLLK